MMIEIIIYKIWTSFIRSLCSLIISNIARQRIPINQSNEIKKNELDEINSLIMNNCNNPVKKKCNTRPAYLESQKKEAREFIFHS